MSTNIVQNSEFRKQHTGHPSPQAGPRVAPTQPSIEQIRERAYFIFLARNGEAGNPHEDWARAERELCDEGARRSSPAAKPAEQTIAGDQLVEPRIGAGIPAPSAANTRRSPVLFSGG